MLSVTMTYEELVARISRESIFDKQVLVSKDWLGHDILAGVIEAGEDRPNILITAGVHGDEPAGVLAAIKAAEALPVSANLYVLFCRDPVGYSPLEHVFSEMFEEKIQIADYNDLNTLCKNYGEIIELEELTIGIFRNICLVYKPGFEKTTSIMIAKSLSNILNTSEDLREKLDRMRVLVPSLSRKSEKLEIVSRAFYVMDGKVIDYDCLSKEIDLPENIALRDFIDSIKPSLIIDLHEGEHQGFCVIVPEGALEECKDIIDAVRKQVEAHGMGCTPPEGLKNCEVDYDLEIERVLGPGTGIARLDERLVGYANRQGISLFFSSERKRDFKERVETHIIAVHSAVHMYATLYGL